MNELSKPSLFTPNVLRGVARERYRLYRHGEGIFSLTPKGKTFVAKVEADDCGLGCKCGAFITPISMEGRDRLAKAKRF